MPFLTARGAVIEWEIEEQCWWSPLPPLAMPLLACHLRTLPGLPALSRAFVISGCCAEKGREVTVDDKAGRRMSALSKDIGACCL